MTDAAAGVAALRRLSQAVLDAEAADAIVDLLITTVRQLLAVDQVHLTEVSPDAAVGQAHAVAFEGPEPSSQDYTQVFDERPSGAAHVVATGRPHHVPDARGSAEVRADLVERFDAASLLFVPLAWRGEVRYVLILVSHRRREFTPDEIELAGALCDSAAAGLALRDLERRRASQQDRDAALARAARAITGSLELETVLATLAREADSAVGGDMAGVYLSDGAGGGIATAGHNTPPAWLGYRMRPGEGVAGLVLSTGRSAITNAYQSEVRLPAQASLRRLITAVSVPVSWGGELRGALSVGFARMRRVTRGDLRTLEAIADLAAVACQNAERFERVEAGSQVDSLTGLLDHSAFLDRLEEEIARAQRERGEVACAIADLDDFEAINEAAGHERGDQVLQRVAVVLRERFRTYDVIARYGGDEFAVVLTACGAGDARVLAERLRLALRDELEVGCSIGIAAWTEPLSAAEVVDRSLSCLRAAKRQGKGQVVVSTTSSPDAGS